MAGLRILVVFFVCVSCSWAFTLEEYAAECGQACEAIRCIGMQIVDANGAGFGTCRIVNGAPLVHTIALEDTEVSGGFNLIGATSISSFSFRNVSISLADRADAKGLTIEDCPDLVDIELTDVVVSGAWMFLGIRVQRNWRLRDIGVFNTSVVAAVRDVYVVLTENPVLDSVIVDGLQMATRYTRGTASFAVTANPSLQTFDIQNVRYSAGYRVVHLTRNGGTSSVPSLLAFRDTTHCFVQTDDDVESNCWTDLSSCTSLPHCQCVPRSEARCGPLVDEEHRALHILYTSIRCPPFLCPRFESDSSCRRWRTFPTDRGDWGPVLPMLSCENGHVVGLDVRNVDLGGHLPTQLALLSELRTFQLYNISLQSSLPTQLGRLNRLQGIGLHANRLTGVIPSQLAMISGLRELRLHVNSLSGSIPPEIASLRELVWFEVYHNALSGSVDIPQNILGHCGLQRPASTTYSIEANCFLSCSGNRQCCDSVETFPPDCDPPSPAPTPAPAPIPGVLCAEIRNCRQCASAGPVAALQTKTLCTWCGEEDPAQPETDGRCAMASEPCGDAAPLPFLTSSECPASSDADAVPSTSTTRSPSTTSSTAEVLVPSTSVAPIIGGVLGALAFLACIIAVAYLVSRRNSLVANNVPLDDTHYENSFKDADKRATNTETDYADPNDADHYSKTFDAVRSKATKDDDTYTGDVPDHYTSAFRGRQSNKTDDDGYINVAASTLEHSSDSTLSSSSSATSDKQYAPPPVGASKKKRKTKIGAWLIDPATVKLGKELGAGAFGVVYAGKWKGARVAVKQIKQAALEQGDAKKGQAARDEFARELETMAKMQPHANVVQYYGVTELGNGDMAVVLEFCSEGALVDALYGDQPRDLSPAQQLRIAHGAACGLVHLHDQGIIHRDIAARNVLLHTADLIPKLADFGMARKMDADYENDQETKSTVGPVRWMAPEQLKHRKYSKRSDVYSFGVLLYEIWAKSKPWPKKKNNMTAAAAVMRGRKMTPPAAAPDKVQALMSACWAKQPSERPKTIQVRDTLVEQLDDSD